MDIFGGFGVLKLYLHRLPAKAAKFSCSHFWNKCVYCGITKGEKGKKYSLQFKTSKGDLLTHKNSFMVKYCSNMNFCLPHQRP